MFFIWLLEHVPKALLVSHLVARPSASCYGFLVFMKVLLLNPDGNGLFDPASPAARRFVQYGALVERFDVLHPDPQGRIVHLSDRVTLYGVHASTKIAYLFRLVPAFFRRQAIGRYDVLSTRDTYYLGALAAALAWASGIGLEIQVHGFEKLGRMRRWVAGFALRRADHVRAVSERLRNRLITEFGVPADRISVYPIYVDGARFLPIAAGCSSQPRQPFTFVTVGRLVPVKEIALQLQALAEVRKTHAARLIVVGDGPLRAALEDLTRQLRLEDVVEFVGSTHDVGPFLAQADAFLLTSQDEGYGLAPIEAACAGVPVIMTEVGCAGEAIRHEENGLLIPVGDRAALIAAMSRIMEDASLRATIRERHQEAYRRLPSLETTLAAYRASWERARRFGR